MKKIEKPWGFEIIFAQGKDYVGKKLVINSGCKLSLQYHEKKEETVLVESGELTLHTVINEVASIENLPPGTVYHIYPGMIHRFENKGEIPLVLTEVSSNHLDDVIRLEDDYGR